MPESPFPPARSFVPRLTRKETVIGWIYLPIHVFLLPILLNVLQVVYPGDTISDITLDLAYYAVGLAAVGVCFFRLLRREFDRLCDRLILCVYTYAIGWILCWTLTYLLGLILMILGTELENPNNAAIGELMVNNYGRMLAVSVVGAPIVEEVLFRGVVFQSLRKRNRVLAYAVSVVLFSLYHVWGYAFAAGNPKMLLYALQYVPLTLILTWTYERSGSLWTAIAFHSSYNFLAMYLTQQLQMIS